ncbi:unnamed protein product, partial [Staurois parvus]
MSCQSAPVPPMLDNNNFSLSTEHVFQGINITNVI